MQYGVDIAAKRIDDLDKSLLEYVRSYTKPVVLELGCGAGGLVTHLVAAGATVKAFDIDDYSENILTSSDKNCVHFTACDMRELPTECFENTYAAVVMQRVLHYLPHADAVRLLRQLRKVSDRLYISVSGVDTKIATYYTHKKLPLEKRFGLLDREGKDLFSIQAPICLYTQTEFTKTLTAAGWEVERIWTSAFGNHKAICV